jgi:hypothetical protein
MCDNSLFAISHEKKKQTKKKKSCFAGSEVDFEKKRKRKIEGFEERGVDERKEKKRDFFQKDKDAELEEPLSQEHTRSLRDSYRQSLGCGHLVGQPL